MELLHFGGQLGLAILSYVLCVKSPEYFHGELFFILVWEEGIWINVELLGGRSLPVSFIMSHVLLVLGFSCK